MAASRRLSDAASSVMDLVGSQDAEAELAAAAEVADIHSWLPRVVLA
jgi:hypothetical protein